VSVGPGVGEPLVELVLEAPEWASALPDLEALADAAARAALTGAGRDPAAWSLSLLACDDGRIAALNGDFRGRSRPTNVLSWPAHDPVPADFATSPPDGGPRAHLGDVALALQTCAREAEEAGISLKDHATHLILHGVLHLLGFDHGTEAEAARMEDIERRAMAALGLSDPYNRGDAPRAHSIE